MRHVNIRNNVVIALLCLVAAFFIVLFSLGGVVDYLSQISNDFLNRTGLGFADGDTDPSFLWVLLVLILIVTGLLMLSIQKLRRNRGRNSKGNPPPN